MRLPDDFTLPQSLIPAEPPGEPVHPRDAATVVLLRDTGRGPEVFLQRRVQQMAFAGGMTVFPGGGVDPRDSDTAVAWRGPSLQWWADAFGCDRDIARGLVCAAVRETFEESGVLLAGPDSSGSAGEAGTGDTVVRDTGAYADARAALVSREISLAEFLANAGLVLRADLLRPWANWVTPEAEPRRYDTRFFVAAIPDGQGADAVTSEAVEAYWRRPADALDDWKQGRCGLMPPTWMTLTELAEYGSVDAVLATKRTLGKIIPKIRREGGQLRIVLPDEPEYAAEPAHSPSLSGNDSERNGT